MAKLKLSHNVWKLKMVCCFVTGLERKSVALFGGTNQELTWKIDIYKDFCIYWLFFIVIAIIDYFFPWSQIGQLWWTEEKEEKHINFLDSKQIAH